MKIVTIPSDDFVAVAYHPETTHWTLVMKHCVIRNIETMVLEEDGITMDLEYTPCENCEKKCDRLIWSKEEISGAVSDLDTQAQTPGTPATEGTEEPNR